MSNDRQLSADIETTLCLRAETRSASSLGCPRSSYSRNWIVSIKSENTGPLNSSCNRPCATA